MKKKLIVKRKQKDIDHIGYLYQKSFQTFAVTNEYLSKIGNRNNKQQ